MNRQARDAALLVLLAAFGLRAWSAEPEKTSAELEAAARSGDADAQYRLGMRYLASRERARGAELIRQAAEKGNPAAENNLGYLYEHGIGVEQNSAESERWYRKAADHGLAVGARNLGVLYGSESGESLPWFTKAAELGQAHAQFRLGRRYERGDGVPSDLVEAYKWYSLAGAQGERRAQESLLRLERVMSAKDIEEGKKRAANFVPGKP